MTELTSVQAAYYNRFVDAGIRAIREHLDLETALLNAQDDAIRKAARDITADIGHRECLAYCNHIDLQQSNVNKAALEAIRILERARQ